MGIATIIAVKTAAIKTATLLFGIGKITIIPALITALAYFNYDLINPENHPRVTRELKKSYDFIVIGGGSAGNVVVNRLTENPEWNVLLLEAGGHENEITDVPILSLYLHKTKMDWQYRPQPQDTACQAMVDHRCCWTRGKVWNHQVKMHEREPRAVYLKILKLLKNQYLYIYTPNRFRFSYILFTAT